MARPPEPVLRRLRIHTENTAAGSVNDIERPVTIDDHLRLTIFPIPIQRDPSITFDPDPDDMDGQILLAAIYVKKANMLSAILLTNDNALAIRARAHDVRTSRYSYRTPPAYTGRRDITVPTELFNQFIANRELSKEAWEDAFPFEPALVANEFIVMTPPLGYRPHYFEYIGRYDVEEHKIVSLSFANHFPVRLKNAGQAIYAEALMHPDIDVVICTGPAGTGKTYLASIYAYDACVKGQFIGTTVIPCQVEDDGVGYLPGELKQKLDPNVQPIKNAIRNYLISSDKDIRKQMENAAKFGACEAAKSDKRDSNTQSQKSIRNRLSDQVEQIWSHWFESIAIAYARGRDFSHQIAIYDEFQDQNRIQADTLLKRLGHHGKIIITGDIEQIHSIYLDRDNNGITYTKQLVKGAPMVAQISFDESEVVRPPFVRLIAERQREDRSKTPLG